MKKGKYKSDAEYNKAKSDLNSDLDTLNNKLTRAHYKAKGDWEKFKSDVNTSMDSTRSKWHHFKERNNM
jgi:ElaB/YqjD/DUF883 family membrane-anchored ribosome-binding protein